MTPSRAFPLVLVLAALPLWPAAAQQMPPPACQQLLAFREETQRHAQALQAAGQKKAAPEELCRLFKVYLAAESKMVMGLEESYARCGLPADVPQQVKASHAKASQMGKQVCDMAAQGPRPGTPLLFDAPAPECTEKMRRFGLPCVD